MKYVCLAVMAVVCGLAGLAAAAPAGSLTVWAHDFDTANIRVSRVGQSYADKHPCIWNGEKYPNQAEYELEFPVTGAYRFVALYAAHGSRPVDIYLDGKKIHRGFAGVTGSWQTSTAKWETQCTLRITTDDPDETVVDKILTGNTPAPSIDVPPDQPFPPTVIQSVDACSSLQPFPVSNTGLCPLTITDLDITGNDTEYSLAGLPSFPIILEPGHIAGSGDLQTVFAPEILARLRTGEVTVTYLSEPIMMQTTAVPRALCGEGARTGARVLVVHGGLPLDEVKSIKLQRLGGNRNNNRLDTVDHAMNLLLVTETPAAPCPSIQYHREYSTHTNPIQLLPGSYQVSVMARIDGKVLKRSVGFDVDSCGFNSTIVVDF
jgi:hypothetical protein